VSGHKIGALSGVGALIIGSGEAELASMIVGGPQETRQRAGTENLVGIVSFGIACRVVRREIEMRSSPMQKQRDYLEGYLQQSLGSLVRCNFQDRSRLPNTISLTVPGVRADDLVIGLDLAGLMVSSGSACASGKPEGSHVLKALSFPLEEIHSTIRLSLSGNESFEELEHIAVAIEKTIRRAAQWSSG
jgi:cysteine desulfurase